jgi:ribosomal-protein-alanine N-acetyltransferase
VWARRSKPASWTSRLTSPITPATGPAASAARNPATHVVVERFCAMIGHWTLRGFGRLGICLDPAEPAIGHVGPLQLGDGAPELTWTLWSADHEGHGYATEAARCVLDHLFAQGWPGLVAHVAEANAASHAVARRLGGMPTGAPSPTWLEGSIQYRFSPEGSA